MEYSSDKKMTRKEYLKSKHKDHFVLKIVKYTLLLVVVALLGIYLFKQLNVYNNVTKIANKVVEETALARTMKMYYVAEGYTKDAKTDVVLYSSNDNSRTKVNETNGMTNLTLLNGMLYGIKENKLYYINLETGAIQLVIEQDVKSYVIKEKEIYFYSVDKDTKKTGIYIYDTEKKESNQIINITIYQMLIDDQNVYVISKGKTEKSVIKYNLNGSGRTVLSDKEIVSYMIQDDKNIYFVAKDKLYKMKKSSQKYELVMDSDLYLDSNINLLNKTPNALAIKDDNIYYIKKAEEPELCIYNVKSKEVKSIVKKNVESMLLIDNILYYKLNDSLELHKVNLESGKRDKVTSIRGSEYICVN